MASEWYYSRDGEDHGPVSSVELKSLATKGVLRRTDLLWKEGMAEWKPASDFPRLFPDEQAASVILDPEEPADENPFASLNFDVGRVGKKAPAAKKSANAKGSLASLKLDVATASKKATQGVKAQAKVAGKIASLTAERTKISTVALPLAYAQLGEHCYRSRTHASAFPDLFGKLDAVHASLGEEQQRVAEKGDTIAETAMAWAEQGMNFARTQAQGLQAKTLCVQLGKACFNQFGSEAGPEQLVAKVRALKERLATINAEVTTSVKKTGGAKAWLTYGGGAFLCLMMLGALVSEKQGSGSRPRRPGRGGDGAVVSVSKGGRDSGEPPLKSGSKGFKEIVGNLSREGFLIKQAGMQNGGSPFYSLINAVVCHKGDGEDDAVVCVAEFGPIIKAELNIGEMNEHIVARRELMIRVGCMHAMLSSIDQAILDRLSWSNSENGRRMHKDTTNGTTEFIGILLIGSEKALVSWPQKLRWFPEHEIWRVDYEDQLVMFGNDDIADSRPSTTRLIQTLLTGGR